MSPDVRRQIGERLREARKQAELDPEDVARDFQITVRAVYSWETGATLPNIRHLYELGFLYGVSLDYLMYGVKTYPMSTKAVMKKVFPVPGSQPAASTCGTPGRR